MREYTLLLAGEWESVEFFSHHATSFHFTIDPIIGSSIRGTLFTRKTDTLSIFISVKRFVIFQFILDMDFIWRG